MTEPIGGAAPSYTITARLSRDPSDAEIENLSKEDEELLVERNERPEMLRFTCEAETLSAAIADVIEDVGTVPELSVLWIEPDG